MRTRTLIAILGCLMIVSFNGPESGSGGGTASGKGESPGPMVENVSFLNVTIKDNFWRPRIEINRLTGIRHALKEASESIEDFDIAAVLCCGSCRLCNLFVFSSDCYSN